MDCIDTRNQKSFNEMMLLFSSTKNNLVDMAAKKIPAKFSQGFEILHFHVAVAKQYCGVEISIISCLQCASNIKKVIIH